MASSGPTLSRAKPQSLHAVLQNIAEREVTLEIAREQVVYFFDAGGRIFYADPKLTPLVWTADIEFAKRYPTRNSAMHAIRSMRKRAPASLTANSRYYVMKYMP